MAPAVTTAVKGGTGNIPRPINNNSGHRRGSSGLFSGLINQKRNSMDEAGQARRASFNNMKPTPGFFGRMWDNFIMGPTTPK